MQIPSLPFTVTDWAKVTPTIIQGETGQGINRVFQIGDLTVRLTEYSAGYLADHWCDQGHVLYVLEGELEAQLKDGRSFVLTPGMSFQVSDSGDSSHRSYSPKGAKIFVVE